MHMCILSVYVSAPHVSPRKDQESVGNPITDSCGPPHMVWKLNPGPLAQQPVLFITEISLQSLQYFLKEKYSFSVISQVNLFILLL